ncbi:unnamed protein product [Sphagnum jensenii]|uniref:Uncharacterized protein n=1 Tax=Sphagnum jensenii TaxID=128206 RepID=A0ABP1BZW5_9BRYO
MRGGRSSNRARSRKRIVFVSLEKGEEWGGNGFDDDDAASVMFKRLVKEETIGLPLRTFLVLRITDTHLLDTVLQMLLCEKKIHGFFYGWSISL